MGKFIKVSLAVLFFLCLADMPYGYFQFVRFTAMAGFGYLAVKSKNKGNDQSFWIYGALTLLFQPFFKISLGREMWNVVDVIVGIGLLLSAFSKNRN